MVFLKFVFYMHYVHHFMAYSFNFLLGTNGC